MMIDYSATKNYTFLQQICSSWLEHYNFLLQLPHLEQWERSSIEDAILSEKIFDV